MADEDLAEIERRLDAGEWLRPGQVAALFHTSRTSIHRWMSAGRIRYRRRGPRRDRVLNPDDVRRELAEYRRELSNGNGTDPGAAEQATSTEP